MEHKDFGDRIHVGNERVTGVKGAWVTQWGISRYEKQGKAKDFHF